MSFPPETVDIASIKEEWPFWDDLHAMWKELPNYRPIGVSNSSSGQDLAEDASDLFFGQDREQAESQDREGDSDDDESVKMLEPLAGNEVEDDSSEKEEEVDELKSDVEPEVCDVHNIMIHPIQLNC